MDEHRLRERLERVEALLAGGATDGERTAAAEAKRRILERLHALACEDPPIEFRFALQDVWTRKLLLALLRRYELRPYRYRGQRYTTVMVRAPKRFIEETLWPEFQELSSMLTCYLEEVTARVVAEVHPDSSEAAEEAAPSGLAARDGE